MKRCPRCGKRVDLPPETWYMCDADGEVGLLIIPAADRQADR